MTLLVIEVDSTVVFRPSIPVFTLRSVFAIFAGFVKIVALVGALLTSSSTAFH